MDSLYHLPHPFYLQRWANTPKVSSHVIHTCFSKCNGNFSDEKCSCHYHFFFVLTYFCINMHMVIYWYNAEYHHLKRHKFTNLIWCGWSPKPRSRQYSDDDDIENICIFCHHFHKFTILYSIINIPFFQRTIRYVHMGILFIITWLRGLLARNCSGFPWWRNV